MKSAVTYIYKFLCITQLSYERMFHNNRASVINIHTSMYVYARVRIAAAIGTRTCAYIKVCITYIEICIAAAIHT